MGSQMIHHSAFSFKKLRSMKLTFRRSLTVMALHEELSSTATISGQHFLGQFGEIVSARVLEDRKPLQLFVVFAEEWSAIQAISWCNQQPFLFSEAKHGYHKYCLKFLNHKRCRKKGCLGRHSWCDTKDIMDLQCMIYILTNCQWTVIAFLCINSRCHTTRIRERRVH